MARKFVGIALKSTRVEVVLISHGLRGSQPIAQVEAEVEIPAGAERDSRRRVAAALKTAVSVLRERRWADLPIGIALPPGECSYRVLQFPFSDAKRIGDAVGFEIDGKFPVALNELVYDHTSFAHGKMGQVLVAAARRDIVSDVGSSLRAWGFELRAITTPAAATAMVVPRPPKSGAKSSSAAAGHGVEGTAPVALIVDIGATTSEVVAIGEKGIVAARSFRFGTSSVRRQFDSDEAFSEAATAGLEIDAPEGSSALVRGFEKLVAQVERSLQWLRAECEHEAVSVQLAGLAVDIPNLAPWLTARLGLPTELLSLQGSGTLHRVGGHDWRQTVSALGAAVSAARRPSIQLYEEGREGLGGDWLGPRVLTMATLALCILAGAAVDTAVRVHATEREREAHMAELRGVTSRVFGEAVDNPELVHAYLEAAQGGGFTEIVPTRGAFDVLALVSQAATPDPVDAMATGEGTGTGQAHGGTGEIGTSSTTGGGGASGTTTGANASGIDMTGTGGTGELDAIPGLPVVPADAGIVADDELVLTSVDIRPRKVALNVQATRASAKERFKRKLQRIDCIAEVTAGKTRDRADRKVFSINFDHDCYRKQAHSEEE